MGARGARGALPVALLLALTACAPSAPLAAPLAAPAPPARPQRIVSLDYCADQFVLKLADRDQITALSPHAQRDFSYMRDAARGLPQARGGLEDVLTRDPDLVVRAYGGGPRAPALLARAGVPVADVGFAEDFDGVRANIRALAKAFGHPERGEALIAAMDARLAAAAARGDGPKPRALYMTPGGVTTGEGSLVHAMIAAAGLENFEDQPGWRPLPLERLARERPDLIAAAFFGSRTNPVDGWSAARHPVAQRQLRERPVVGLEGAWTACGGWFLVEAVEALAEGRAHVETAP